MLDPAVEQQVAGVESAPPCPECAPRRKLALVNTVSFDVLTLDSFAASVRGFIDCGGSHVVHFLAAHPTVVAREVPNYRALLNSGDLLVSDGTPIALTMKAKGFAAQRITGADGFGRVCADGLASNTKHFFVGGADGAVAEAMQRTLRADYPGIEIAGFVVPPFRPYRGDELDELAVRIRASGADVVWVGLGAPKQDLLAHQLRFLRAAPVIVCIGAVFDFVAGTKRRAPRMMRALGLEWLFRLLLEPGRLGRRYLVGNSRFVAGVLSDQLALWKRARA